MDGICAENLNFRMKPQFSSTFHISQDWRARQIQIERQRVDTFTFNPPLV